MTTIVFCFFIENSVLILSICTMESQISECLFFIVEVDFPVYNKCKEKPSLKSSSSELRMLVDLSVQICYWKNCLKMSIELNNLQMPCSWGLLRWKKTLIVQWIIVNNAPCWKCYQASKRNNLLDVIYCFNR